MTTTTRVVSFVVLLSAFGGILALPHVGASPTAEQITRYRVGCRAHRWCISTRCLRWEDARRVIVAHNDYYHNGRSGGGRFAYAQNCSAHPHPGDPC